MTTNKVNLGHGYFVESGYHYERGKTFFFVDISKDGSNLIYDSKLIKKEDLRA